jgi:hypothetical protein
MRMLVRPHARLFPRDGALRCHGVDAKSATDGIRARRRGPSGGRTTESRNENMRLRALRRVCITAVGDVFRVTQRWMRLLEIEMRIESRPSFEKRARRACERLWTEGVTCRSEKSHFEGDVDSDHNLGCPCWALMKPSWRHVRHI